MTTTAATKATSPGANHDFMPGLEGLRGFAVLAVLLFHGGFSWARGGYLGVSVFFTLSGFLITTNILRRAQSPAGMSLRDFWGRRFRRLLPAALAAILLASAYTALAGDPTQRQNFSGDSISSLFYVANWHFIFSGQTYAALFSAPSALLHFWSLAIEEQFYLVFPLIALVILARLKLGRWGLGATLTALLALSLFCTLSLGLSENAIYLGTATRSGEIVVGALFAVVMTSARTRRLSSDRGDVGAVAAILGVVGLIAAIGAYATLGQETAWLYRGGLTAFSLVSLALIIGAISPIGPTRRVLASRPLRRLGLISYGVYLYHWPVFLCLSPDNTGLSAPVLFLPRVAISIGLAVASYRLLEQPVRSGRRFLGLRPVGPAVLATCALILVAVGVTAFAPTPALDFTSKDRRAAELNARAALAAAAGTPTQAIFGDSTAIMLNYGMADVFRKSHAAVAVGGPASLGCGLLRGYEISRNASRRSVTIADCDWQSRWKQFLNDKHVDIATIMFGPWDARGHRAPGSSTWLEPGDAQFDAAFRTAFLAASDLVASKGAVAIWITNVPLGKISDSANDLREPADHPEWQRHVNELMIRYAAERPQTVRVVDLARWYASTPHDDARNRPDGIHFEETASAQIARDWLNQAIIDAYMSLKTQSGSGSRASTGAK